MKKTVAFITMVMILFGVIVISHADVIQSSEKPVIGIAWRADTDSEFFTNICKAVEETGAAWVMLDQVQSADLDYDADGKLTQEEITVLGKKLLEGTLAKMSDSGIGVLKAANVDINAIVTGAGEALIARIKNGDV